MLLVIVLRTRMSIIRVKDAHFRYVSASCTAPNPYIGRVIRYNHLVIVQVEICKLAITLHELDSSIALASSSKYARLTHTSGYQSGYKDRPVAVYATYHHCRLSTRNQRLNTPIASDQAHFRRRNVFHRRALGLSSAIPYLPDETKLQILPLCSMM